MGCDDTGRTPRAHGQGGAAAPVPGAEPPHRPGSGEPDARAARRAGDLSRPVAADVTAADSYPRDDWLAALYEYGPRGGPRRAVARVFADFARGDLTWCPVEKVEQRTGLGRSTVYYAIHGRPALPRRAGRRAERAVPGLVELGWLTLVTKRAQHYSPRYRLTIPEVPERAVPEVPERAARGPGADSRGPGAETRGPGADSRGPGARPDHHHTSATPPPPAPAAAAVELADAVVVVVEKQGVKPDRRILSRACERLAELGWTPEQISREAQSRSWAGAGGGAVTTWARSLDDPPAASSSAPSVEQRCSVYGHEHYSMPCQACRVEARFSEA